MVVVVGKSKKQKNLEEGFAKDSEIIQKWDTKQRNRNSGVKNKSKAKESNRKQN